MLKSFLLSTLLFSWLICFTQNNETQNALKKDLFNAKDFTGWTKYIGVPHKSLELSLPKDSLGNYKDPIGSNDFLNIFSVVQEDSEPAIYVSGKVFGTISSVEVYKNYHISLQYKWGAKKYAPRLQMPRDAGLLYHAGDKPLQNTVWPQAQECQIQEGDCGDYWKIHTSMAQIPAQFKDSAWIYESGSDYIWFGNDVKRPRCRKNPDNEKPHGEWNTVEVYTSGDSSVHMVNGKIVMHLKNLSMLQNGMKVPMTSGRIVLQSEGAELYYRRIVLEPIQQLPFTLRQLF